MERTKKNFGLYRILSVFLCFAMILSPLMTVAETVAELAEENTTPTRILIEEGGTKNLYKLVENYTAADISTSKTYMIASTDVPGEIASTFGSKGDYRYLQTVTNDAQRVFEVPVGVSGLPAGKYIQNGFSTERYGEWQFEKSGEYYHLRSIMIDSGTEIAGYLGTHPNGGMGGYHPGHFILLKKNESATRVCNLKIAEDNVDLSGFRFTYSSDDKEKPRGVTGGTTGYLSYGSFTGVYDNIVTENMVDFNLVTGGSAQTRIQLYEKVGEKTVPKIEGYVYSKEGTVAVNTGKFAPVGAFLRLYINNMPAHLPITTDMISGEFNIATPGTYTGLKVSYNGVELCDDFTLTVKEAKTIVNNAYDQASENSSIYKLADPNDTDVFVDGGYIHIAETQEPGFVRVLSSYAPSNIFGSNQIRVNEVYVNGEKQLIINGSSSNTVWKTTTAPKTTADEKWWNLSAVAFPDDGYLSYSTTGHPLRMTTDKSAWQAQFHMRNETTGIVEEYNAPSNSSIPYTPLYNRTGLSVENPNGTVEVKDNKAHKDTRWYSMFYNYGIGNFGLRADVENNSGTGNPVVSDVSTSDAQPYDRVFFYTRTSEFANATVYLTSTSGTVPYGSLAADSPAGVYLVMTVTDAFGASQVTNVPVTLDMLTYYNATISAYDSLKTKKEAGTSYSNVRLTYQGVIITDNLSVTVEPKITEDNNPDYPNPGSVKLEKDLNTEEYDYLQTGVTEVQLSVTGVPDASGSDVVLVLDNSGSMANPASSGGAKSRREEMVDSIKAMLGQFADSIEGYNADISVSIITFDGYTIIDQNMLVQPTPGEYGHCLATTIDQPDTSHFLTPTKSSAKIPDIEDRFIHSSELTQTKIDEIANSFGNAYSGSGTNYDRGLHLAYETLLGKQKLNAQMGNKRNSYVVFMSDGCPWQFNYVGGGSTDPGYATWNNYLLGKLNDIPAASRPTNDLYGKFANSSGKHWMAEAIKGDTDSRYQIINPSADKSKSYIEWVNGLGAEIYAIGFGIVKDNAVEKATALKVLENISSDSDHFFAVENTGEIENVFEDIATKIRSASGAVLEDKMGAAFDLQMASTVNGPRGSITLDPAPSIEVYDYTTYTLGQVGTFIDDVIVEMDMVGKIRPGYEEGALLEQVTFNPDGTEAYSNATGSGANILDGNGIINAKTFKYNTNKDVAVQVDTNGDGVADYELPAETFVWLVGNIPQSKQALHYDVYLEGSMEGERDEAEVLYTNEYARLKYKNYIGNECIRIAPKPLRPWTKATATYKYYLVNGKGEPIDSNGNVTTFENAVQIAGLGDVTKEFYLNEKEVVIDGNGEGQIPSGYALFDDAASYKILAHSASEATGDWEITKGEEKATTYVESGSLTTTENTYDNASANYSNTTVWFALVPTACVDDSVVIDFGLPVEVDVIENDNFGNGKTELLGYAPAVDDPSEYDLTESTPTNFVEKTELQGQYGKFISVGNNIRYTLDSMKMPSYDKVTYGVKYTESTDYPVNGNYFGNLTVIPATTVYFEDNFVSFKVHDYATSEVLANKWTEVKSATAPEIETQRDDRVGEVIANVYGNDAAYADSAEYSFGSAQKVTVSRKDVKNEGEAISSSSGTYATAEFTFTGTGFDVISLTSNKTGTIAVQVFSLAGETQKSFVVDTYYGYKFEENVPVLDKNGTHLRDKEGNLMFEDKWIPTTSDDTAAIYQIPVVKVKDLAYNTYKVVITASYSWLFDHGQYEPAADGSNSYDFYLDAIRIYDPANDGKDNEVISDAYAADGESFPVYKEIRNILIDSNSFDATSETEVKEGVIFIDNENDDGNTTYTMADYKAYGPNNELYLKGGQSIAFEVDFTDTLAELHIAAKMLSGSASLTVQVIRGGSEAGSKPIGLASATDMYYDITDLLTTGKNIVLIRNDNASTGIVSITNIKLTSKISTSTSEDVIQTVSISKQAAQVAIDYLNALANEPEVYSVRTLKHSVKAGSPFTAIVTTSADAEYIVVNGETFTKYTENKRNDQRTWKVTLTVEEKGVAQIGAIAYNSADVQSEEASTTIKVTKASAFSFNGIFSGFFDRLFGR